MRTPTPPPVHLLGHYRGSVSVDLDRPAGAHAIMFDARGKLMDSWNGFGIQSLYDYWSRDPEWTHEPRHMRGT